MGGDGSARQICSRKEAASAAALSARTRFLVACSTASSSLAAANWASFAAAPPGHGRLGCRRTGRRRHHFLQAGVPCVHV